MPPPGLDWFGNPTKSPLEGHLSSSTRLATPDPYQAAVTRDQEGYERLLADRETRYGRVTDVINDFQSTPNSFYEKNVFDDPLFQRIQRSNRDTSADDFNKLSSKVGSSLASRGVKSGRANDALQFQAAEQVMRDRMKADNDIAKELKGLYNQAGIARDSILGSLLSANINYIANDEMPMYDYSADALDQKYMASLDEAIRASQQASEKAGNPLLDTGIFGSDVNIRDIMEAVTPFLAGRG